MLATRHQLDLILDLCADRGLRGTRKYQLRLIRWLVLTFGHLYVNSRAEILRASPNLHRGDYNLCLTGRNSAQRLAINGDNCGVLGFDLIVDVDQVSASRRDDLNRAEFTSTADD